MIDSLTPYTAYKDSGLPWLGQVPEHWEISHLASLARVKTVNNQKNRQLLSVYLHRGVVRFSDVEEKRTNATSTDLSNYQAVDPGNLVLNNQQAWRGSVGVSKYYGIVSPAYIVLELSKKYIPQYANLFFRDGNMVSQYVACSKGVGTIQRNLYWPHLKRVGVILPPPAEQAAIVRFLEWAGGRLERTIRAKRKIIALLNEQKQAIIHRAVTRGLDPDVPLKDSGIPWLGEIPAHWEVRRMRHACEMRVSNVDKHTNPGETPVRLCNYVDVYKNDRITQSTRFMVASATEDERLRFRIRVGDVLITKDSEQWNDIGVPALVEHEAPDLVCGYHLAILRSRSGLMGSFLYRALESRYIATQFHVEANGVTRYGLSHGAILGVAIPLPPPAEQAAIVAYLDVELERLTTAISRLEREIELLREYRTRLISDVVTGKLDVRTAAATLPDDAAFDQLAEDTADTSDDDSDSMEDADGDN